MIALTEFAFCLLIDMSSVDRKDMVSEELQKTKESDYINNISVCDSYTDSYSVKSTH